MEKKKEQRVREKELNINNYTQWWRGKAFSSILQICLEKIAHTSTLRKLKNEDAQWSLRNVATLKCFVHIWIQVKCGKSHSRKNFALWSIERSLTVIKRKLKFMLLFDAHLCLGYVNMPKHFQCFGFSFFLSSISISVCWFVVVVVALFCLIFNGKLLQRMHNI